MCVCVCVCVFHYFYYYLPDFVTAICLGFFFGSHVGVFVLISFNAITNHFWNIHWSGPGINS